MKIGIVTGSIREKRVNLDVAEWVLEIAENYGGAEYEILDIKTFELPLFAEPVSPAFTKELNARDKQKPWSDKVEEKDGFIFVTPEYNHGLPSALKNALDFVYQEFNDKAAGIVSYGSAGGVRAAEQLRTVLSEFQVAHVRTHPSLSIFYDFDYPKLKASEKQQETVETMLSQLLPWTKAMMAVRENKAEHN
ncbi:putative reductase [Alkalibacterium sp. AK22]|uniref:NADPH-dependent FMN reductase n=1 Tax=Alkalibacterium sp. AK22 TaxID=1229520 RepID=UPI0004524A80|nr:NADPH-dependent FMN reductase [Alkalibacterium sp. AK22]EXJ24179.1 putative reductase [Alkalibacterium sp. AK22]